MNSRPHLHLLHSRLELRRTCIYIIDTKVLANDLKEPEVVNLMDVKNLDFLLLIN